MKQKTNALLDVFGHLCILFSKLDHSVCSILFSKLDHSDGSGNEGQDSTTVQSDPLLL